MDKDDNDQNLCCQWPLKLIKLREEVIRVFSLTANDLLDFLESISVLSERSFSRARYALWYSQ